MARPGVQVTIRDTIPPRSQASDVDTWFVAGVTEKGPQGARLVRSMAEFEATYGLRVSYGTLWDAMDVFFREGGAKAYVARVYGAAAVAASKTINAAAAAPTVTLTANSPGDWGEHLDVAVVAGSVSGIRIQIWNNVTNLLLEQSPDLTTKAAVLAWMSSYVNLSDANVSNGIPVVAARAPLTGGDDDIAAITDALYTTALARFDSGLGSGQVSIPGDADTDRQIAILDHCSTHNRSAILDAPDTATVATIKAHVVTLRTSVAHRYGALFGPRATVPGIVPATVREVPYSAVQAGMIARLQNPNEPAAGANGIARYATSVKYDFTDDQREDLNANGFNVARNMLAQVRTYGYRTLVDPNALPQWLQFNAIRTVMAIKAEAESVAEEHIFKQIDGRGVRLSAFQGALIGMMVPYYESGALYGQTPEEAFYVDAGSSVNTPVTIADGQLKAIIAVRTSPFGELITIEIVKQALPTVAGQALA